MQTKVIQPQGDTGHPTATAQPEQTPRGVWGLSFVEMWERYSFYGIQAILTLYLVSALNEGGLEMSAIAAGGIVGGYGGAVYLSQLLGAWFGERVFAPKLMVLFGAIIICSGHVVLALIPGLTGLGYGLGLIVIGTGCLKTNITMILGQLYADRPQGERDAGFSYFYMGISIGAVLGPLTTGLAQSEWGFHFGFGSAAVVIFASLIQYLFIMRRLPEISAQISNPISANGRFAAVASLVVGSAALAGCFHRGLLPAERLSSYVTLLIVVAAVAYFVVMLRSKNVTESERSRVRGFIPVFIGSSVFFGLLFQIFTTAPLLALDSVDLAIGDWSFPVGWIGTLSTGATVVAAPILARSWKQMGPRQPSGVAKVSIGLLQIAVAFGLLAVFSQVFANALMPLAILLLCMVVIGSSEMLVGPVGLSLASRVGPERFKSQMVGLNFLSLALGSALAGSLAQLYSVMNAEWFFTINAGAALIAGGLLWMFRRTLAAQLRMGLSSAV